MMELTAWRITLSGYADTAFDGEGARRYGGRFNSPGTSLIYVSSSLSVLEVLVHVDRGRALARHVALPVTFDSAKSAFLTSRRPILRSREGAIQQDIPTREGVRQIG